VVRDSNFYFIYLILVKDVVNLDFSISIDYPQLKKTSVEFSDEFATGFPLFWVGIIYTKKLNKPS
jgi:hypothetical protein